MEIKFNAKDRVRIPDGCKAIVEDGMVIFEKEESKEQEFKRGDVIVSKIDEILLVATYDFDSNLLTSFVNIDAHGNLFNNPYQEWNVFHDWRLANEEEKQQLFDKMKEQGLRWNAEEKRVEKIRWRAEDGKEYYYVGNQGILMVDTEDGVCADENRYEFSNYFRTSEQVEEAAKRVKEVLRNYHEEIGE